MSTFPFNDMDSEPEQASDFMSWQIPFCRAHLQRCSSAFCLEPWMVSWGNWIVGFIGKEPSSKLH